MTGALRGMALMFLAMQIVPVSDVLAKLLSSEHEFSVVQTAWSRMFFSALILLPFGLRSIPAGHSAAAHWQTLKPHWWRGALWAGATLFYFAAIKHNPLPDSLALLFIAPLFVAITAPILLGEHFSPRRVAAVAIGFCGVLAVLRPAGDFSWTLLFGLAAGLCYGGYLMATRRARNHEHDAGGARTALMAMLTSSILMTPLIFIFWQTPSPAEWGLMLAMGGLSALGHLFIAKSCEYADASRLAPFIYTEMFSTAILSYIIFNELPDTWSVLGITIIIGAGLYVMFLDLRKT